MIYRSLITALAATLLYVVPAAAFDEARFPDWKGQWSRLRTLREPFSPNPSFDPNKYQGLAQRAPLTPEYQAILEASLADQVAGGADCDRKRRRERRNSQRQGADRASTKHRCPPLCERRVFCGLN